MKVDAVSPKLYSKITLQEDDNTTGRISTTYTKYCMLKCVCSIVSEQASYVTFKLTSDLKTNAVYLSSYSPLNEGHVCILTNSMLRTYQ